MNIGVNVADPDSELYGLICEWRRGVRRVFVAANGEPTLTLAELLALSLLRERRSRYGRSPVTLERRGAA